MRKAGVSQIAMTKCGPPESVQSFIIQAIDPNLGCPVLEALFPVADLEDLRPILEADAAADPELRRVYTVDPLQLRDITERFGLAFDPGERECFLARAHSIRDVPYLVHTGYELLLMLDGVKPFAKFYVEYPVGHDDLQQHALFEPHVQSGLLVKRVMPDEPLEKPIRLSNGRVCEGVRQVYYALRGEEWRIDAHILLWKQINFGPWNETLERLEGSLLGYTDEQNDLWAAYRRRNNASIAYTDRTAYVAVDSVGLAWICEVGERAFRPGESLELVLHFPCPEPAILENWLKEADAAAIVRVRLPRDFLSALEFGHRDGARSYRIRPENVPALNRSLTSLIEVVSVR